MFDFLGVIDGAIIIQLTGFPVCIKENEKDMRNHKQQNCELNSC